jgi:4-hydroxy-tetrahydrodipicolinate synthase
MQTAIRGIFNILATPFAPDGRVDVDSLESLADFQVAMGAHGLTILGVLGEAAKLTVDERRLVTETVMATVNGRIPVVVGASHPDSTTRIRLARKAVAAGAAGVMIAPPRMGNPTGEALLALYGEIAAAVDGVIVVQDFPPVNGVIMSPDFLADLGEKIPAARYLKLEDPPLMQKIGAIRERTDRFEIFGGLGGVFLLEELKRGCSGTMTGFAFTEILVAVYDLMAHGRSADAETVFDRYLPLIRFENQPVINLAIRKALLKRRGAIAFDALREPFAPIDAGTRAEIEWVLRRVGIEDPAVRVRLPGVDGGG